MYLLAQQSRNQKEFNHEEKLTKLVLMKLVPVKIGNGEKKFLYGNTISIRSVFLTCYCKSIESAFRVGMKVILVAEAFHLE